MLNLHHFGFRDVFQERDAGVKRDFPVERWQLQLLDTANVLAVKHRFL